MNIPIKNKKKLIIAMALSFLPLLSCILRMALDGYGLWDYHLSATIGNDEVFYYKYVEGILEYGHPMGFFGFNESRAAIGGGTAWSPAISWYWIIFGKLIGWNYIMPMVCNILVMSLAMFIFGILARPSVRQAVAISFFYLCYGQLAYYTLSGVPECIIYGLVIVFIAGVVRCWREYAGGAVLLTWITAFLLTIMRPYYIVLFFLPLYFFWFRNKKQAVAGFLAGTVSTAGIYAFFNKYMTASYFGQSVLSREIDPRDFEGGPWRVFKNLVKIALHGLGKSFQWMREAFLTGNFQGRMLLALFFMFLITLLLFFLKRKEKRTNILLFYFVLYFPIRFAAAIYLYDKNVPPEAIRHAFDFILIAGLLFIMLVEKSKIGMAAYTGIVMMLLVTQFVIPMLYKDAEGNSLDYATEEEMAAIYQTEAEFAEIFDVKEGNISYANDVIWVFVDYVQEERTLMEWKRFYALPAGMALNICFPDYVKENYDTLQSAYLAAVPGGDVALLCVENDAEVVYNSTEMVIYKIN